MLFFWMFIVFVLLTGIWRVSELFSSFDERQRYYQLKGYQLAIAGVFAVATVLFFVEERPAWLDFRNSLFLIMVGGVIPFIVYSIWHDAYFEARKKQWEEVIYLLVILLIEFSSWKVISSEHFNLKDSFSAIMQAIWFGAAGLTIFLKLIIRHFEDKE
ncbi:hypothetical protein [Streptococcus hillyeri]|uniref:Uncharacterized protein n=1 Tax=Streptococcus hillyeri TaxID=2282420 RepID=A0A3L9DN45_9STRE|nr:hypothetical protein [Streptococcus hillyeri]RLY01547.1 hypothetical protein EAF07_09475 [Streptococcus hillyeri]